MDYLLIEQMMVCFMQGQGLLVVEVFMAVGIAAIEGGIVVNSFDFGVEAAAQSAHVCVFVIALIAEVVGAGEGDDSDVDGIVADGADFGFALQALWVLLGEGMYTRTVVFSKKTTSSSQGGSRGYLFY